MKKILYSGLLLLSVAVLPGCEKNFDPHLYGTLNSENFPSTQKEYESYVMGCYVPFINTWVYNIGSGYNQHGMYIPEGGVLRLFEVTSDAMAPWTTGWGSDWLYFSQANFSNCVNYWRGHSGATHVNHFQKIGEITRFTEIIGMLEKAPDELFTGDKKKNLLGEAHLCRGLMMYYVLHIYGPMPVILNPDNVNDPEVLDDIERPALAEMSAWIKDDFEFAVANMAESVGEQGRYTADYARFCLMKHCLNEGGHMDGYYARAMEMYDELDTGKYSLFETGSTPWADLFKNANKFNSEIIMAVSSSEAADGSSNSGNFFPFMMLAVPSNAAKTDPDGNPTPFVLQGGGWGQNFSVAPKFYDTYDPADKRRDMILTEYWTVDGNRIASAQLGSSWTGYIINKFPIETATPFQGTDFPLARWADVLLMFAELDVRISGGAPSPAAVNAVNKVRERALLGGLSAAETANADAFLKAVLRERGHEFLYEGLRKIDLIRFNKYAQAVFEVKGVLPTHQYMPLPNYAVEYAAERGKTLDQTYSRPGWIEDVDTAIK
jgi:hypothetical protein